MSDKPISVGDLVMVVKPSTTCGCSGGLGRIFRVEEIESRKRKSRCQYCGFTAPVNELVANSYELPGHCELSRLKRIDPPAEGDSLTVRLPKKQPVEA